MEILVVDGYNVIGASIELSELKEVSLEESRNRLQEDLMEYSAYTGRKVILVYDAHLTKGTTSKTTMNNIEVHFTNEGKTADEYIEKLVAGLIKPKSNTKVYVATSDLLEQRLVFGLGALRVSSRELLIEIKMMKDQISNDIHRHSAVSPRMNRRINPEIAKIFESWRRQ